MLPYDEQGVIPDYSIVRGQPARVFGKTTEIDEKLLSKYPILSGNYYLNKK